MTPDAVLLKQYAETLDADAFGELVRRYEGLVYGVCYRVTRNAQDAQDVAQECFLALALKASTVSASLPGWLHRVAHHKAANKVKDCVTRKEYEGKAIAEVPDATEEAWKAISRDLDGILDNLDDELRVPLVRHYLQRQSQQEIAADMGISQPTLSRTLQTGISELRSRLRKKGFNISAVALDATLMASAVVSVPEMLSTALGKMAMAGIENSLITGTAHSIHGLATTWPAMKIVVTFLAVVLLGGIAVVVVKQLEKTKGGTGHPSATAGIKWSDKALPGSPGFMPSVDNPIGWRGDWTGRFPGANPPTEWGRWPKGMNTAIRYMPEKPDGNTVKNGGIVKDVQGLPWAVSPAGGKKLNRGGFQDWLALGPFDVDQAAPDIEKPFGDDEAEILKQRPDAGTQTAGREWKLYRPTRNIGFSGRTALGYVFNKDKGTLGAYLHTYVFVSEDFTAPLGIWGQGTAVKAWVNGRQSAVRKKAKDWLQGEDVRAEFKKGWNSLLLKVISSGENTKWDFVVDLGGRDFSAYETKNVVWMARIPESAEVQLAPGVTGVSSPLVVGEKILLCVDPHDVLCINKNTGKAEWLTTITALDLPAEGDKARPVEMKKTAEPNAAVAQINEQIVKWMNSHVSPSGLGEGGDAELKQMLKKKKELVWAAMGSLKAKGGEASTTVRTPCSDGKNLYFHFNSGLVGAVDLCGKKQWTQLIIGSQGEHSRTVSPVVIDNVFIVDADDWVNSKGRHVFAAFDVASGKKLWETPIKNEACYGSFLPMTLNGEKMAVSSCGDVARVSDGKPVTAGCGWDSPTPTAILNGDVLYSDGGWNYRYDVFIGAKLGGGNPQVVQVFKAGDKPGGMTGICPSRHRPGSTAGRQVSSYLYHDDLIYVVDSIGWLMVFDAKTAQLVYSVELDMYPELRGYRWIMCSSPALGGKHIYAFDNVGTAVVFEPGREFKQVGKNTIENQVFYDPFHKWQEQTQSTPVFDGNRMYMRTETCLYCIAEK